MDIQYKYLKMDLEQFAMFEENYDETVAMCGFQTATQFSFDKENNVIGCTISVTMTQNEKPILKAIFCNYFEIHPDSIADMQNEKEVVFDIMPLIQFASLSYGALRGVLHIKTLGTDLNKYILPPVYFDEIIKTPFVAKLEE